MEDANICKICECKIDEQFKESECKQKSFAELVNDLKSKEVTKNNDQVSKLGTLGIIRWLLATANRKELQASDIEKIVEKCAHSSDEEIIDILKKSDVYVEVIPGDSWRSSALHYAIKLGTPEIVSWILDLNINSHVTPKYLSSMLSYAGKSFPNFMKLISLGADVTESDSAEIIKNVCLCGNLCIFEWLLAHKEFTDQNPKILKDALYYAIYWHQHHLIEYLVQHGANLNSVYGKYNLTTYIQEAAHCGNVNYLKWLIENGIDFSDQKIKDSLVLIAAEKGHLELLKWLVSQGCNIHTVDEEGKNALHKIALKLEGTELKEEKLHCMKYLIHKKVDINAMDSMGYSPMYYAASSKNLDIVRFLIAHGGNIHAKYRNGNTLLYAAANSVEMMQMLISLRLDINIRNNNNESVLNIATKHYIYKSVDWLLQKGLPLADFLDVVISIHWLQKDFIDHGIFDTLKVGINYINDINILIDNETLLYRAVDFDYGNLKVVEFLVENNADVNKLSTKYNNSPLIHSLQRNMRSTLSITTTHTFEFHVIKSPVRGPNVAQYLLSKGADVTIRNNKGETALYYSLMHDNLDLIKQLIELGADVNAVTSDGTSILQKATVSKNLEIIKLILESGAEVNPSNRAILSCLEMAAVSGSWDIIRYFVMNHGTFSYSNFLRCGVESADEELVLRLVNSIKKLPLHNLCEECENSNEILEIIKLMIDNGSNIHQTNGDDETLLHTFINYIKIVNYLLGKEIHINVTNIDGKTALHNLCIDEDNIYCESYKIRIVNKLIKHGAIVNTADSDGVTPLHSAVNNLFNIDIVRVLIANGADVRAKDTEGNSVLHYAVDTEIAMLLLDKGADINAKNNYGVTVLQKAIENAPEEEKSCSVIKLLKRQNLGESSKSSETPSIDSIMYSRYIDYIEYLISNVDINVEDNDGYNALYYAKSHPKILNLLRKKGVK